MALETHFSEQCLPTSEEMIYLRRDRVERPSTFHGQNPELEGLGQYRTGRWPAGVFVTHQPHDGRAAEEQACWQHERQPEPYVSLGVHHADLAGESTDVDHQIEVHVDAGDGHGWVHNDAFPALLHFDVLFGVLGFILLGDERRDVGLEATSADAEDDETNTKAGNGAVGGGNDRGKRRDDEEDVADDGDEDGDLDGLEAAPVLIGHVGSDQWHEVSPHGIERRQAGGRSLAHTQRTRLPIGTGRRASG